MKTNLFAALIFAAALSQTAHGAVEVTAFRIEETRTLEFGNDNVSRNLPEMKVVLSLHGPEAEASVHYGQLKLEEAVDDLGGSLIPEKDSWHDPAKFRDYSNAFFRKSKFGGAKQPADPQVEITLASGKRAAKKIARLRGTLVLSDQGTIQTVELGDLKQPGKRKLAIPAETHFAVTVAGAAADKPRSLGIEISGDEAAMESIEIVDASGHKVSSGMSSWSMDGGPKHQSIDLSKPLDDSMKLVVKYTTNRKLTTVPFDLKDITLP